jgi:hypothetical protein
MNLHQALKKKNKLVGDLNKVNIQISGNTRWLKGNTPSYNLEDLLTKRTHIVEELNNLKVELSRASAPILPKIFQLAELKSATQMFKNMSLNRGFESESYRTTALLEYDSAMTEMERDKRVENMEAQIAVIQDEIDAFNAVTKIME